MYFIVLDDPVVPFATPSVSSVLAVVCHRVWVSGRNDVVLEVGWAEVRALRTARAKRDLVAILQIYGIPDLPRFSRTIRHFNKFKYRRSKVEFSLARSHQDLPCLGNLELSAS